MVAYAALAVLPLEESVLDGVLDDGDVPAGFRGRASVLGTAAIMLLPTSPLRRGLFPGPLDHVGALAALDHPEPPGLALERGALAQVASAGRQAVVLAFQRS